MSAPGSVPSCPDPWGSAGTVPYTSQEDAKDRGWCQAADMSRSKHIDTDGFEEAQWLHGSANPTGDYSAKEVVSLFFLPSSNASAVGILSSLVDI